MRSLFTLGVAALIVLGLATTGVAQTTYYACVSKDGTMRMVRPNEPCRTDETLISWSPDRPAAPVPTVRDSSELLKAVWKGDKELVARLLASGANVDEADSGGLSPLCWAIQDGHREIVELLLSSGANVQTRVGANEASMLHIAVDNGRTEIAKLLLARGLDVNLTDNDANTPLHIAASVGHAEMVSLLLAKGANVNARTNQVGDTDDYLGTTPLHLAALNERAWRAASRELRKKYTSVGAGKLVDTAALLLANGADVNAKNAKGNTPLRLASSKEMKALLQKHGAK